MKTNRCFLGLMVLFVLGSGCGQSRSAPAAMADVDVAALRTSFGCASPSTPERTEACRILNDFAAASTPTDLPASGLRVWFGAMHCVQPMEGGNYEIIKIRAGTASATDLEGYDVPQTKVMPGLVSNPTINARAPDIIESYSRLETSLAARQPPMLDGNTSGIHDPRTPMEGEPFMPWFRTAGPSAYLGNHAYLSLALRGEGARLLAVQPQLLGGCAAELHRMPPAPPPPPSIPEPGAQPVPPPPSPGTGAPTAE